MGVDNNRLTVDNCADRVVENVLLLGIRGEDPIKSECSWIFLALMSEEKVRHVNCNNKLVKKHSHER